MRFVELNEEEKNAVERLTKVLKTMPKNLRIECEDDPERISVWKTVIPGDFSHMHFITNIKASCRVSGF